MTYGSLYSLHKDRRFIVCNLYICRISNVRLHAYGCVCLCVCVFVSVCFCVIVGVLVGDCVSFFMSVSVSVVVAVPSMSTLNEASVFCVNG